MAIKTTEMKDIFKEPKIIGAGIIIASIILGLILLQPLKPLIDKNKQLSTEILKKKKELSEGIDFTPLQKQLKEEIKKLSEKISNIETNSSYNIEDILITLNRFAEEAKISFKNVDPQEKIKRDVPNRKDCYTNLLPINIKVKCGYKQLLSFLNKISKSEKIIKVEAISIQSDPNNIWEHDVQLNLLVPLVNKCES